MFTLYKRIWKNTNSSRRLVYISSVSDVWHCNFLANSIDLHKKPNKLHNPTRGYRDVRVTYTMDIHCECGGGRWVVVPIFTVNVGAVSI